MRRLAHASLLMSVIASALGAQRHPPTVSDREVAMSEAEVAQILKEVLQNFIVPRDSVHRPRLEERRVVLDWAPTMRAFGIPQDRKPSRLGLGALAIGSEDLLSDCGGLRLDSPCDRLGWDIYLHVRPYSVTATEALVLVTVGFAGRPGVVFEKGVSPPRGGRANLSMRTHEMILRRDKDGAWRFDRLEGMLIGA